MKKIVRAGYSWRVTTGAGCVAEGPRLSAKPLRPSAKSLPSAALGKAPSAKFRSAKTSLPRAIYRALGKARHSAKREIKKCEINLKKFHGIFRAKFAVTRAAEFELVTSLSHDTSSATCTTHSHASICRFGYSNIILN
jgi:hypothetical protein